MDEGAAAEAEQRIGGRVDRESLATKTLADIYLAQGYRDKALHVLHRILERQPDRDDIRAKIVSLETATTPDETPEAAEPTRDEEPQTGGVEIIAPDATGSEADMTAAPVSETVLETAEPATADAETGEAEKTAPETTEPVTPPSLDDQEKGDRKKYFENWIQKISRQPDD
jgi:hypothetical protein